MGTNMQGRGVKDTKNSSTLYLGEILNLSTHDRKSLYYRSAILPSHVNVSGNSTQILNFLPDLAEAAEIERTEVSVGFISRRLFSCRNVI